MPIELAALPKELNPANPTFGDPVSEGYQHDNLVKGVLRATFGNLEAPVTAKARDLNNPLIATDLPPEPTGIGATQLQTLPYYNTYATASTTPLTDFGKALLNLQAVNSLSDLLGIGNLASKDGGTFTGAVTAPEFIVTGGKIRLGSYGVALGTNCVIGEDEAQGIINVAINGAIVLTVNKAGVMKAKDDIIGFVAF